MIEKPKLLAIVIIITLAGIIGLYFYAVLIEAKTISIGDLNSGHIGSIVETEGHIKEVNAWKDGDLQFILVDYESGKSVDVNIDAEAAENLLHQEKLIPGAKIKVSGLVEDYKGNLLIHVRSSEGIKLLKTADENTLPIGVLLERPEVFQGIHVVVQGTVWNIEEIESIVAYSFTIQNFTEERYYSVSCIMFNSSEFVDLDGMRIHSGDEVIFSGIFEYYEQQGIWQLQSGEESDCLIKVN